MSNPNDLARIDYVLQNYDDMDLSEFKSKAHKNSDGLPADIVLYNKRINGYYYVAEAAPDSKAKALYISSAYKNKKLQAAFANDTDTVSQARTSETQPADSNNSIRNNSENVNPKKPKAKRLKQSKGV
jgi:hypothetical protein